MSFLTCDRVGESAFHQTVKPPRGSSRQCDAVGGYTALGLGDTTGLAYVSIDNLAKVCQVLSQHSQLR